MDQVTQNDAVRRQLIDRRLRVNTALARTEQNAHPAKLLKEWELQRIRDGNPKIDDLTLMVIRRLPEYSASPRPRGAIANLTAEHAASDILLKNRKGWTRSAITINIVIVQLSIPYEMRNHPHQWSAAFGACLGISAGSEHSFSEA